MSDYYHYQNSCCGTAHAYLLPSLSQIFADLAPPEKRIFDLGCGNGSIANWLSEKGFQVSGCDPSESGIAEAKRQKKPILNLIYTLAPPMMIWLVNLVLFRC